MSNSMAASPAKLDGCPAHARGPFKSLDEYRAGRVDGPQKCPWFPGTTDASVHQHIRPVKPKILNSILDQVRINAAKIREKFPL